MRLNCFSWQNHGITAALALVVAAFLLAGNAPAWARGYPAPDPPHQVLEPDGPIDLDQGDLGVSATPSIDWVHHKSADGAHPDGNEQQMLWLMNRARTDPGAEGLWLATTSEPDIAWSRNYFGVNTSLLQSEFNSYGAKLPAAFDRRLYEAAINHCQYLASIEGQTHDGQFDRVTQAGFEYTVIRGNVFSHADNALNAHAAFNIDWGNVTDGMQSGRPHRQAIMALDGNYTNVGLAVYQYTGSEVGPYVVTGNYCHAAGESNHYNTFIVGTVWEDLNGNGLYDPGEGKSMVKVMPSQGDYYAFTSAGGGYAIPTPDAGTYTLTFSGGELAGTVTKTVEVINQSVLCDVTSSGGGGNGGDTGQNNYIDDFRTNWEMNHGGWLGTLVLGSGFLAPGSPGDLTVGYVGDGGAQYYGWGLVRTPNFPLESSWGPDHQIEFYIDFKNDNGNTKFLGYLFTEDQEAMAGIYWWHNSPYGFYALKGAGGSSLNMGDYGTSADIIPLDFWGSYEMNHDGRRGHLYLNEAPPDSYSKNGRAVVHGTWVSDYDFKQYFVHGYIPGWGDEIDPSGPDRQLTFYIDFNGTYNRDDDQKFVGYLFSKRGPLAGYFIGPGGPYGFYALR